MRKIFFTLCFFLLIISCEENISPNKFDQAVFDKERKLWQEQNIQNYTFQQRFNGNEIFSGRKTIIVKDGVCRYFYRPSPSFPEPYSDFIYYYVPEKQNSDFFNKDFTGSISDFYTEIDKLAKDIKGGGTFNIEYNSEYHYPTFIEYYKTSLFASDKRFTGSIYIFSIDPEISEETPFLFDREAFTAMKQEWENLEIKNYTFDFSFLDFVALKYWNKAITVKNSIVENIISGNSQVPDYVQDWMLPVDDIFSKIEGLADGYVDGGMQIITDYFCDQISTNKWLYHWNIYYLFVSPNTPTKNESFKLTISAVKQAS